jgi:tetratricopeptide (TPR) repeat protein
MELHLARPDLQATQVAVICDGAFSHPFDLHSVIPTDTNGLPHPLIDPLTYGKALYAALFPPDSLASQALAARPKRLLLVADDEETDAIPWEYTYGPDGLLACRCAFVRGLPEDERIAPPGRLDGLHIVAVASSPLSHHLAPLNIGGEWTRLTEMIDDLDRAVTLERAWPPTIERLRDLVVGGAQRVVHFMGHGGQNAAGEAVLCFEREDGAREDITAHEFVARVEGGVFLVTLGACQSATPGETSFGNLARALVRERVPYALGMRFSVYDEDALAFSRTFYRNLARGVPVEEALRQARLTLARSACPWAAGNVVLYTALSQPAPGYTTISGEPQVRDAQEKVHSGLIGALPEVPGAFQGRIDEQRQLGAWLTGDRRPRIVTIHGSGGQGKTALARVVAERFAHAWPGGVWALSLETLPTRALLVANLARFVGINLQESADQAALERQILLRLRRRRTLLVLDNIETLDAAVREQDAEALAVSELLQQLPGERTSLLCTSRHLLGWPGEHSLELSGLSPQEGAALFAQSAPHRAAEIEQALAEQLSRRIDGHPLGLALLGKAFNESPIPLAAFLADHEKYLRAAENMSIGVEHRQRTLWANVAYSVRWLSPELRETLSKLWIFHAPFLPEIAVRVLDPEHAEAPETSSVVHHLYTLWQRGLLTRESLALGDEHISLYRLPPVIRPFVEEHLTAEQERAELLCRFGSVEAWLAQDIYRKIVRGRAITVLALQCYDDLARGLSYVEGIELVYYLLHWGGILHRLGDQLTALSVTEQALELAEGQDRALEGLTLHNLALLSCATGHPREALRLDEQALIICREVSDRTGEAATLNTLGSIYDNLGQKQQALDYYRQALVIYRKVGNRDGEATALNNIGQLYNALGQPQQALPYLQQAIMISREMGNRTGESVVLNNIGQLYNVLGQKQQALNNYQQALAIQRKVDDRAGEGTTLNNLGLIYDGLGEKQQALDYYRKALGIRMEVGDRDGEATTLHNIGGLYARTSQFDVALACVLAAKKLYESVQNPAAIAREEQWIAAFRRDLGEEWFAALLAQVEPRIDGLIERALLGNLPSLSALLAENIALTVHKTIAVMTAMQERRNEWRKIIVQLLQKAREMGSVLQREGEFFTAILALLDGQPLPVLAADHPYASAIAAIQEGIAAGGPQPDEGGNGTDEGEKGAEGSES